MAVSSSTYQDIIDWALSQQNHEATHGQPAPLNQSQRKMVLDLHQIIKPVPQLLTAPDIGDTDWVSLLYRYRQSKPGTSDITFTEQQAVESTVRQPCWNVFVALEEHPDEPFPLTSWGSAALPSFVRKKDARQYAAKCAAEWLMAERLMPDNGRDVTFPRQQKVAPVVSAAPPAPKRQKLAAAGAAATPPASTALRSAAAASSSSPAKQEPKAPAEPDMDMDEDKAVSQVVQLCKELGMQLPVYKINRENGDFWGGHAEFDRTASGADLPLSVGEVTGVYGSKKSGREAVAGQLLKALRKIKADRKAIYDELINDLGLPGSAA
ncbi:hypothetical protein BKA67DRAFT_564250 [Truncatella angustata]|uniref:DRBM domain-containing protein n=1 Tax=Truncatella angustata TaxID=152316 RepID=A0A9P8UL59_9PEZI|nr:uncharacterized protein BKA67DRAFT_564250 [Truncatella angustata]KAH6654128.1 hypothetical protein BKA67DRAFT_564250 [Truncatella angustata]